MIRRRLLFIASLVSLLLFVATGIAWTVGRVIDPERSVSMNNGVKFIADRRSITVAYVRDFFGNENTTFAAFPGGVYVVQDGRRNGDTHGMPDFKITVITVHYGYFLVLFAALPVFTACVVRVQKQQSCYDGTSVCRHCHYNLTANTSGTCPECGTPVPGATGQKPPA